MHFCSWTTINVHGTEQYKTEAPLIIFITMRSLLMFILFCLIQKQRDKAVGAEELLFCDIKDDVFFY